MKRQAMHRRFTSWRERFSDPLVQVYPTEYKLYCGRAGSTSSCIVASLLNLVLCLLCFLPARASVAYERAKTRRCDPPTAPHRSIHCFKAKPPSRPACMCTCTLSLSPSHKLFVWLISLSDRSIDSMFCDLGWKQKRGIIK